MKMVIVGEAYGRFEEQFQHPLVGATGRELSLQIGHSGLGPFLTKRCRKCGKGAEFIEPHCPHCHEHLWPDEMDLISYWKSLREEGLIHVTNVFNVRPPNNDIGLFFGTERVLDLPPYKVPKTAGGSHLKPEYYRHVEALWSELDRLRPNLVICMGNTACWAVLGDTKISVLRGTINWSKRLNLKALPTYHPAAVLRQWSMRPVTIADLQKAKDECEFPEIRRPERWVTIPQATAAGLDETRAWLTPKPNLLACDIETVRGQISIVGFAKSTNEALVVPFRDCHYRNQQIIDVGQIGRFVGRNDAEINYWPTPELEREAWRICINVLEDPSVKLIFQNGIYDMSYFLRMGILPRGADHDTMLWHHSEYLELPKSLGFLGSLYSGDVAWKAMAKSDTLKRDE